MSKRGEWGQVWKVGGFIAVAWLINFPESQLTCGCGSKSQMNFPLLSQVFGPVPSISDYFPFGFACQIEVCQGEEGSGGLSWLGDIIKQAKGN